MILWNWYSGSRSLITNGRPEEGGGSTFNTTDDFEWISGKNEVYGMWANRLYSVSSGIWTTRWSYNVAGLRSCPKMAPSFRTKLEKQYYYNWFILRAFIYFGSDRMGGLDRIKPCFFNSWYTSPPASCHQWYSSLIVNTSYGSQTLLLFVVVFCENGWKTAISNSCSHVGRFFG